MSNSSGSTASEDAESNTIELDLSLPADPSQLKWDLGPTLLPSPPANMPADYPQWDIQITLTETDVGVHSLLQIPQSQVHHIMQHLSADEVRRVHGRDGLRVKVMDLERIKEVPLMFKFMTRCQAYALIGKWFREFVDPRRLRIGSVVGLRIGSVVGLSYWNQTDLERNLLFQVLKP